MKFLKDFWKGIVIVIGILALIGGIWAFDSRYVLENFLK